MSALMSNPIDEVFSQQSVKMDVDTEKQLLLQNAVLAYLIMRFGQKQSQSIRLPADEIQAIANGAGKIYVALDNGELILWLEQINPAEKTASATDNIDDLRFKTVEL